MLSKERRSCILKAQLRTKVLDDLRQRALAVEQCLPLQSRRGDIVPGPAAAPLDNLIAEYLGKKYIFALSICSGKLSGFVRKVDK